jgi:hypothetical protein
MRSGCSFRLRLGSGECVVNLLAPEAPAGLADHAEESKTDYGRCYRPGKLGRSGADPYAGFVRR